MQIILKNLTKTIHPHYAWLAISVASLASFFVIGEVIAQTPSITQPTEDLLRQPMPLADPLNNPVPYQGEAMYPPTSDQLYQGQYPSGQQPYNTNQPANTQTTDAIRFNCGQCQRAKSDGSCEMLPMGSVDPTGNCGEQVCDGRGGCVMIKDRKTALPNQNNQPGALMGQDNRGSQNFEPGMSGQQGPSEEELQKMDGQRLEQMKRGLTGFINSMNRVKKQVAQYAKKGVTIPDDLKQAVGKVEEIAEKIKNAQTVEEVEELPAEVEEVASVIQEWLPQLPRLAAIPQVLKQASREMSKVKRVYANDERKAKKSKMNLSDVLGEFKTAINEQQTLLNEIKGQIATDPAEALDRLQDEFFGNMDNMWEKEQAIQVLLNLQSGINQISRELKAADKVITNLKKKKIDTTELASLLSEAKIQYEEVKKLAAVKPIDADAVVDAVDELMDAKQLFNDKVEELTGENEFASNIPREQSFNLNLPEGFIIERGGDKSCAPGTICN